MFGAWEVGVWRVLRERFQPDLIVGASAGALNGWAIAGGCSFEELANEWMDPLTAQAMQVGMHSARTRMPAALYAKARELFERYHPRVPFGLVVVELPRLRARLVRDGEITWRHLAATCSVPMIFPPVDIEGKRYVDGGVLAALPLYAAEQMGATRAVAVNALTTLPFRLQRRVLRPCRPTAALEVIRIEPLHAAGQPAGLRPLVARQRGALDRARGARRSPPYIDYNVELCRYIGSTG